MFSLYVCVSVCMLTCVIKIIIKEDDLMNSRGSEGGDLGGVGAGDGRNRNDINTVLTY